MENAATLLIVSSQPLYAKVLGTHLQVKVQAAKGVETEATALLLLPESLKEIMQMDEAAVASGLPGLMLLPEGMRAQPVCRHLSRPIALETLRAEVDYLLQQPRQLRWEGVGHFDPVSMHLHNHFGQGMALTEKEAAILNFLASQNKPVTAEVLLESLWHYHRDAETHTFDTHLYRLRQKLESLFSDKLQIIHADAGYQIVAA